MSQNFLKEISRKQARVSMFVFFCLLSLSVGYFVFADDNTSSKTLFEDSDQDGLSNDEEKLYGTDPMKKDSDGDGYMDGVEVQSGYDPLKPAPGDKLVGTSSDRTTETSSADTQNLTDTFSDEIASIVQDGSTDGTVTLDAINSTVQKVLSGADTEIILPEVSTDEIKIKKLSKNLKDKERKEKEKEDIVQYLTVMAYIMANNSPKTLHNQNDLASVLTSLSTDSIAALAVGNTEYIEKLSEKGEKMLKEIKDVEVPEAMIDVHLKALKMAKYTVQLKEEVKKGTKKDDPMGQIASLSKVQGFLGVVTDFTQEVYRKLNDYGIKEIPIDL